MKMLRKFLNLFRPEARMCYGSIEIAQPQAEPMAEWKVIVILGFLCFGVGLLIAAAFWH